MTTATLHCPLPPVDFLNRKLPIREIKLSIVDMYRIHRLVHSPIYYARKSTGRANRFDAASDEFGVLYVALTFEGAFMETVVRDRFHHGELPLLIEENDLLSRGVSRLGCDRASLRLTDFTSSLIGIGGDASILSTADYSITNKWSSAVYAHPESVDGILYRSRYSSQECIAVFDRAALVPRGKPVPLVNCPELGALLDQYGIGIAPDTGSGWRD